MSVTDTGHVELWDLIKNMRVRSIQPVGGPLQAVDVSSDGKTIAAAGEMLWLWDLETGNIRRSLCRFAVPVSALLFTNQDNHLVVGDQKGVWQVIDVDDGSRLHSVPSPQTLDRVKQVKQDLNRKLTAISVGK